MRRLDKERVLWIWESVVTGRRGLWCLKHDDLYLWCSCIDASYTISMYDEGLIDEILLAYTGGEKR